MADDNNKNSASNTQETESVAKVGGGQAAKSRRLRIPSITKRSLLVALLIIVLVVVGADLLSNKTHVGQKVYAQAAGHKIYKQDVDNLINNNKSITEHQAATVLADKYLSEAIAKKENITVTSQDVQKAYGPSINYLKSHNSYVYQVQVNQVYFSKLQAYNGGIYKGSLLVAQFSRYISFVPGLLAEQQAINPNFNNPKSIAADRQYAQNFITGLYNQIKSGKISWNQAAQMEVNDHTVGTRMYPTLSHSGPFDTSQINLRRNDLIRPASISKTIRSMKAGQTSKPFVVAATSSGSNQQVPAYYLVVRMDSVAGGQSGLSFTQALAQAKQQLGYKVNV